MNWNRNRNRNNFSYRCSCMTRTRPWQRPSSSRRSRRSEIPKSEKINLINFYEVAQNHSLFFYLIIGHAVKLILLCVYLFPDYYLCNDHLYELCIHVFSKNFKDVVSAFVLRDGVEVAPLAARVLVEPVARVHALVHVASHQVSLKKIIIKFIELLNAIFIKFTEKNESKAYILMNAILCEQVSFYNYRLIHTDKYIFNALTR